MTLLSLLTKSKRSPAHNLTYFNKIKNGRESVDKGIVNN